MLFELITDVFQNWFQFIMVCCVFFVAEILYVAVGFGAGLLSVGTLALVMPNIQDVVVLLLLVNILIEMTVVCTSRKILSWKGLVIILISVGVGIIIGTWILTIGTPTILLGILGVFLLISGTIFAILPQLRPLSVRHWWEPPVGLISGILAGLFGTGGPPLIYYYQLKGTPKTEFRGTLMAIFLFMALIRIPTYTGTGLITLPRLLASFCILPVVIAGALIGNKIHLELEELTFRRLVGIILAIIGIVLLFRLFL